MDPLRYVHVPRQLITVFTPSRVDPGATELATRAAGVAGIGQHTAAYVRQHTGREAVVIHPPIYGSGPFPNLASFDTGLATMVNPCAVKGISIFMALA